MGTAHNGTQGSYLDISVPPGAIPRACARGGPAGAISVGACVPFGEP